MLKDQQDKILFTDDDFLVVDKPAGWLTIPGRTEESNQVLNKEWEKLLQCRLWTVHRLDREVSGAVLFAKHAAAHRWASLWFEKRLVKKKYEAWTEGHLALALQGEKQKWESRLLRGKKRAYEADHGKPSVTFATCKETKVFAQAEILCWQLEPLTGRPHQLRYELAKRGFPIVGDELYGAKTKFVQAAIALRAVELDFTGCTIAQGELSSKPSLGKITAANLASWVDSFMRALS